LENIAAKKEFAKYSPCVYHGALLCEDCGAVKTCEMAPPRISRQHAFEIGWKLATLKSKRGSYE
jgi:hypothetical protein